MRTFRSHIQGFLITVAFVGVFTYAFATAWYQAGGFFVPAVISGIIVLSFLYLLILLMLRQHRERREKLTKESFTAWDEL